eukprot:gene14566-17219_t
MSHNSTGSNGSGDYTYYKSSSWSGNVRAPSMEKEDWELTYEEKKEIIRILLEEHEKYAHINDDYLDTVASRKKLFDTAGSIRESYIESLLGLDEGHIAYADKPSRKDKGSRIDSGIKGKESKGKQQQQQLQQGHPSSIPLHLKLVGINVEDTRGNVVAFTSFWQNKRCVIMCFRRFGCLVCRLQAMDLSSLKPKLDRMGIALIGIGFETLGLQDFIAGKYFAGEIYIDRSRSVYRALSLKRMGFWDSAVGLTDPKLSVYRKRAKETGLPSNFRGDGLQLGATLVLGPKPQGALYDLRQTKFTDVFDLNKILKACKKPYPELISPKTVDKVESQLKNLLVSLPTPVTVAVSSPTLHFQLPESKIKINTSSTPSPRPPSLTRNSATLKKSTSSASLINNTIITTTTTNTNTTQRLQEKQPTNISTSAPSSPVLAAAKASMVPSPKQHTINQGFIGFSTTKDTTPPTSPSINSFNNKNTNNHISNYDSTNQHTKYDVSAAMAVVNVSAFISKIQSNIDASKHQDVPLPTIIATNYRPPVHLNNKAFGKIEKENTPVVYYPY